MSEEERTVYKRISSETDIVSNYGLRSFAFNLVPSQSSIGNLHYLEFVSSFHSEYDDPKVLYTALIDDVTVATEECKTNGMYDP